MNSVHPFSKADELHPAADEKKKDEKDKNQDAGKGKTKDKSKAKEKDKGKKPGDGAGSTPEVRIDLPGIQARVQPVPVPPGNYSGLSGDAKHFVLIEHGSGLEGNTNLTLMTLANHH